MAFTGDAGSLCAALMDVKTAAALGLPTSLIPDSLQGSKREMNLRVKVANFLRCWADKLEEDS